MATDLTQPPHTETDASDIRDPWGHYINGTRATLLWTLGALGVIAASLLAGASPLSSIGDLDAWSGRWFAALALAVVALSCLGVAIFEVAAALAPIRPDPSKLVRDTEFVEAVEPMLIGSGYAATSDGLTALLLSDQSGYRRALSDFAAAKRAAEANPDDADVQADLYQANRLVRKLDSLVDRILDYSVFYSVRRVVRSTVRDVATYSILAAIATVVFLWAANPPEKKEATSQPAPAPAAPDIRIFEERALWSVTLVGDRSEDIARVIGDCISDRTFDGYLLNSAADTRTYLITSSPGGRGLCGPLTVTVRADEALSQRKE